MAEALDPAIPAEIDQLAQAVLRAACDRDLKLATAESCTGGLLASLLTDVPGLSHAFERGFVVYTDEAKHELLGVPKSVLSTDGAVSEAAARAMAEGAVARSRNAVAVSITGYAEAGPAPDQPAGRVHFACASLGRPTTHRHEEFGDIGRAAVRIACLEAALEMMHARIVASEATATAA